MSDKDPSSADPLGQIADEFVEALRQGQRPSVEEFARRYPAHADDLRDVLPALAMMEQAKSAADSSGQPRRARPPLLLPQLGDYQILREIGRGGSWDNGGSFCRASYRIGRAPTFRRHNVGFRLVRVPVGPG